MMDVFISEPAHYSEIMQQSLHCMVGEGSNSIHEVCMYV